MLCPRCIVELTMTDRQGIEIDYCPKCRGVWLDQGELDKIIERSSAFTPQPGPVFQPQPPYGQPPYGQPGYPPQRPYDKDYDDDDDDDDRRRYDYGQGNNSQGRKRKREGFLGDLFDF